jgi:hypothetical protein
LAGYAAETQERRSASNHNLPARHRLAQLTERRATCAFTAVSYSL